MGIFTNSMPTRPTPVANFPTDDINKPLETPSVETPSATAQSVTDEGDKAVTPSSEGVSVSDNTPSSSTPQQISTNTVPDPSNGVQGVSFMQQPTADVAKIDGAPELKLIDWNKPYSEIESNDFLRRMTPQDITKDFAKNGDGNWATFLPWLKQFDPNKTVEQSIKDQKKAERQAKWEQLGNLFMHVGNFAGTLQGAPSMQQESGKDLSERQRKLRESTDALREKGYDQMLVNIYKDRADKQKQMQADAAAKAQEAKAKLYGSQKAQVDALTDPKVAVEKAREGAANAQAELAKKRGQTEDQTRQGKVKLLGAQYDNQVAGAEQHRAGASASRASAALSGSKKVAQDLKNSGSKDADDFNSSYVNDPEFKKYANEWAKNNGMAVGDNKDYGKGGTWSNEKNRQQATRWARAKMKQDRTPPSRRNQGGSKVPPSRRR